MAAVTRRLTRLHFALSGGIWRVSQCHVLADEWTLAQWHRTECSRRRRHVIKFILLMRIDRRCCCRCASNTKTRSSDLLDYAGKAGLTSSVTPPRLPTPSVIMVDRFAQILPLNPYWALTSSMLFLARRFPFIGLSCLFFIAAVKRDHGSRIFCLYVNQSINQSINQFVYFRRHGPYIKKE